MSDATCTFTYISKQDYAPRTTTGIECTWLDLKLEFKRQGEGIPGAKYYKTISEKGPQLFAVKLDQSVWYHDENQWHRYQTATDVKFETRNSDRQNSLSTSKDTTENDDLCFGIQNQDE